MASDSYFTIKSESETEIKIKGSRFIGRAFRCDSTVEAESILADLRKKFYDATHHCFAYRIGLDKEIAFRYSDDGEPNGTAGKPIYDRLEGPEITNTLIVVTRYYGGTKLGTGGLTRAYSESAQLALDKAKVIEKFITHILKVVVQFPDYNNVERLIHQFGGKTIDSDFSDIVILNIELRESKIQSFIERLTDLTSGRAEYEQKT